MPHIHFTKQFFTFKISPVFTVPTNMQFPVFSHAKHCLSSTEFHQNGTKNTENFIDAISIARLLWAPLEGQPSLGDPHIICQETGHYWCAPHYSALRLTRWSRHSGCWQTSVHRI